jgi:CRP-like cAMP-binding protein
MFAGLPAASLRLLESCMDEATFEPGSFLLRQGEVGASLIFVQEGLVEIRVGDSDGGTHAISESGPGDVLGEMALLTAEPRTADAVALSRVRARVLPAAVFHDLAHQHPEVSVVLSQLVARRLGGAERDALAGKTLGGYRIIRRLGRGGMAVVYEARRAEDDQRVALKMMSHRLVYDTAAQGRFQQEADLIESFRHPNIVRLFGRFAAFHTCFMVMEFCDGDSLDSIIHRHGRLPESECRAIAGQLANGLLHAHAAGVVHRDLKPSNVLLNREGIVQLTDFGLALTAADRDAPAGRVIAGTPQYMSPEQLTGARLDERADYFSLGCVIWELIAGTPLISETQFTDILRRHAHWQVPDIRQHAPGLHPDWSDLLQSCLQPEPGARHPDLTRLAAWAAPVDPQTLPAEPT